MSKSSAKLMTEGSIWKRIVAFAIPLFWGNLFQQLYNTADSLIVGNFLGSSALAAVSSSGNLIFLMVGLFNGIAIGSGVIVAKYYGARDIPNLQKSIHTTIGFGLICGVILTIVGIIAAPQILVLMGTPEAVLPNSITYFRIYFTGSLAFVMYNFFVGILQSVGDSTHPLIYLIVSSVTNIILDLVLIAGLGFGVGAAAFATVISQFLSAILCMVQLLRSPDEFRLHLNRINLDSYMLRQIISCAVSGESFAQISERLHYTPRHIQRMVLDYYGESFAKVVTYTRLSYVMALLSDTELSLQEIAMRSGYSSVELMKRRFRQLTLTGFRHAHTGRYQR